MKALVLIRFSKLSLESFDEIKAIPGVKRTFATFGRFDGVALIEGKDTGELRAIVERIQSVRNVKGTETLMEVR